jgi:hypothetical protein
MRDDTKQAAFIADPSCVYFAVSSIGSVMRQFVRVINHGSVSARMNVLPSADPAIKLCMSVKKGYIASGLHQDVEIQYTPASFGVVHSEVTVEGEVLLFTSCIRNEEAKMLCIMMQ